MAAVPEKDRVATLRELGVSESLIRLSCSDELHPQFSVCHKGPPWYLYHGQIGVPKGSPFCGLWEFSETATGVRRRRRGGIEFIKYSFGYPDEYTVLAHTEQGFWATVFDFLYESDASQEELQEAAEVVGFQFLDRLLSARGEGESGTFEQHRAYLRGLVASIDRESGGSP